MGGAERWILDISSEAHKHEKAMLVDVHPSIANIYGRLVLNQPFIKRSADKIYKNGASRVTLSVGAFIPFTPHWKNAHVMMREARRIYTRYELAEVLIILYFGGVTALKKTIAGIHTPFIYQKPIRLLDHVHNMVYTSYLSKYILKSSKIVHVLNKNDRQFFINQFQLTNVIHIPNYTLIKTETLIKSSPTKTNVLNIAYVGELSLRKGTDVLIEIIQNSADNYRFHIAGAGPMQNKIIALAGSPNVKYYDYLEKGPLVNLYKECDVLFIPSRAESFSLSCLEAMTFGLFIISSLQADMGVPAYVQLINKKDTQREYQRMFQNVLIKKRNGRLYASKRRIQNYCRKTFSRNLIVPQLLTRLFELPMP